MLPRETLFGLLISLNLKHVCLYLIVEGEHLKKKRFKINIFFMFHSKSKQWNIYYVVKKSRKISKNLTNAKFAQRADTSNLQTLIF